MSAGDSVKYRELLAPYARPHLGRSVLDLLTSVVPYLALQVAMYQALSVSYWLTLALAIPAAGFLLRTYIIFHDCTHGSFLPGKKANERLGVLTGLLVYSNFHSWRHNHAIHHATAGDLDRRGTGDVETLTVREYLARDAKGRRMYRIYRHPLIMFTIGPFISLLIGPRIVRKKARPRIKRSIILTNVALAVIVGALCLWIGPWAFFLLQWPVILIGGSAGVWLFYVQHQFEDVYWEGHAEWSYTEAALKGSSYLKLPKVLQFFTGNIGLHHVHHLSAKIPNYNLQRAHDENPMFHNVPTLTFRDGLRCSRLKLIDEDTGRLVSFSDLPATVDARPALAGREV